MQGAYFSDVLVDYSGLAKTVNDIRGRFSLLQFLDFCTLIEGLALHDRLIVVGGIGALPERWREALKPLLDAGVLADEPNNSTPAQLDERTTTYWSDRFADPGRNSLSRDDAWFETGRLLGAEQTHGLPSLSLLRQRPVYEKYGQTREQHSVCDLVGHYKDLREALDRIRRETSYHLAMYDVVPIPPLSLEALQSANTQDEIVTRALDTREKYSPLRTAMRNLRADLANPHLAPAEKLKLVTSWKKSWATLHDYAKATTAVELGNTSVDFLGANLKLDNVSIDAIKIEKLVQYLINRAIKTAYSWRVRVLHTTAKEYLRAPDAQLHREIRRLFHHEVGRQDFATVRAMDT